MDGYVEVLAANVLERIEIARRGVALLRAGDVEPDDACVAPANGALGDLDRAGRLAHRGDQHLHDDRVACSGCPLHADPESLEIGLRDLVERQPALGRELRSVADLGVHDAISCKILGALGGDPDDRVALLEDPDRMGERLEIELEGLAVGAASHPGRELVGIGRRQIVVPELAGEIHDRPWPQAAVEMVVEERLRRPVDRLGREHRFLEATAIRW